MGFYPAVLRTQLSNVKSESKTKPSDHNRKVMASRLQCLNYPEIMSKGIKYLLFEARPFRKIGWVNVACCSVIVK
jgi:hypothetical protein